MNRKIIQSSSKFLLVYFILTSTLSAQSLQNSAKMDQSGRRGMLIFSGYYGWWLGAALSEGWDVNLTMGKGEKNISAMPVITTPLCLTAAYFLTKHRPVSQSGTSIITLGAHWGTWQGLGWANVADWEGKKIIQTGVWTGLAGIGAGMAVNKFIYFTPGGATITHSGLVWGAWFGLVTGVMTDHNDNALLSDMLIGSNLMILTLGITSRDINITKRDIYGLNAFGYVNGVLFWLLYWGYTANEDKYDGDTSIAIAGLGSVLGLVVGGFILEFNADSQTDYGDIEKSHRYYSLTPKLFINIDKTGQCEYVPGFIFKIRI